MSAVREALRAAGRESHERLHHHPIFTPLRRPDLTEAQYRRALTALYGFHAPLERRAAELGLPGGRLSALTADLAALGAVDLPPECRNLPPTPNRVDGLAIRRLLDGSALGGRVMAADIARTLGLTAANGAAFFCAGRTPSEQEAFEISWRDLCLTLDAELSSSQRLADACRTTAALFRALENRLDEVAA